ncbi:ankyrin repeat-containing domain protein [Lophiotrema nucula]|uniref:Ankyrin repeat-containing domain protein n=1 Tax=Lophiotrema nucula TaxID=690887 RepID=A0A6A5Z638_9PLEO|nr:ankyrin repeat-containing domain protein [Lophiotrema nucula]
MSSQPPTDLQNGGPVSNGATSTPIDGPAPEPASAPNPPQSPSVLPTAALDLAAKLFDLAREGNTETLKAYVSAGIPQNLTNHAGDTLLMLASYHGHAETTEMLLEAGADPNVLNGRGQSPIAGAVFKGSDDVVKVLYEGGADIRNGHPNAVDCAMMFKRENLLKLFGVEQGEGTEVQVNGNGAS